MCIFLFCLEERTLAAKGNHGDLIIINKSTNQLAFLKHGKLEKVFDVATGRSRSYTPEGSFYIDNKVKNRPYYKEKIAGGSPNNPLGDRWMGLAVPGTWGNTYGIHGTNNEYSIGKYASSGCIRMYNDEVRWLFDQVSSSAAVVITHSAKSFEKIAKEKNYEFKSEKINPIFATAEITKMTLLFQEQSKYSETGIRLYPQTVKAFEKSGPYYHVEGWFGDGWVHEGKIILLPPRDKGTYNRFNALLADNPLNVSKYGLIRLR